MRLDAEQQEEPAEQEAAEAVPSEETTPATEVQPAATAGASVSDPNGSLTYFGVVTDNVTGLPISGVTVTVYRRNSRENWRILETTEHETNSLGMYSFTIPPEQAAESALYIEVEAHQPEYGSIGRSGYAHSMILKNLEMGEQPWFTKLGMWPGEAITGTVVSPEGEPLAGVEISMYSAAVAPGFVPRIVLERPRPMTKASSGSCRRRQATACCGSSQPRYSPVGSDRRASRRLGHADDAGRNVNIRSCVGPERRAGRRSEDRGPTQRRRRRGRRVLANNAVANGIGRDTITDAAGAFTLASLPDGEYQLQVQANSESYDPAPLEHVFLRQSMTIADGVGPELLEIRTVPHVEISATYLDSDGKPRSGHEVTLFGKWDGDFYAEESSVPQADGKLPGPSRSAEG